MVHSSLSALNFDLVSVSFWTKTATQSTDITPFTLGHRSCNFQIGQQKIVEVLADRWRIINDFVVFLQQFLQNGSTKPAYLVIIQMQNDGFNLWIDTQKSCEGYGDFAVLSLFFRLIHARQREQIFCFIVLALAFEVGGIGQ